MAEMIAVDGSAVLRVRDEHGQTSVTVLAGSNPLRCFIGGSQFEVLYLDFSKPDPNVFQSAEIYAKSAAPADREIGLELFRAWQRILPDFAVTVNIRNDYWFLLIRVFRWCTRSLP